MTIDLNELLKRPIAAVDPATIAALDAGPIDPGEALSEDQLDRLLDPAPFSAERGYCFRPDGVGHVAMRVAMPEVTGAMIDWWFDWHPNDPLRYRVWHPLAHKGIAIDPRPVPPRAKPYWGTTHHPVEDLGFGVEHVRIEFLSPDELGFSPGALERPGVAAIAGGLAGDDRKRARHTRMVHVWLDDPAGGTVLRSRFWIGSELRPYMPRAIAAPVARLINRPAARRRLIPREAPEALARHCAEEYTNLAAILPGLFESFAETA